jgi:hypothetical protein
VLEVVSLFTVLTSFLTQSLAPSGNANWVLVLDSAVLLVMIVCVIRVFVLRFINIFRQRKEYTLLQSASVQSNSISSEQK